MEIKPKLEHTIVGIHVPNRFTQTQTIQDILTKYGCSIKTRLGLHEVNNNVCAINGLIILEMFGKQEDTDKMIVELNATDEGIDVQKMVFTYKK